MSKKGVPRLEKVERHDQKWPEDPEAKLRWMLEQKAFIRNKPFEARTRDELNWLLSCDERITLLRIAV
jgi:hypothetical protein